MSRCALLHILENTLLCLYRWMQHWISLSLLSVEMHADGERTLYWGDRKILCLKAEEKKKSFGIGLQLHNQISSNNWTCLCDWRRRCCTERTCVYNTVTVGVMEGDYSNKSILWGVWRWLDPPSHMLILNLTTCNSFLHSNMTIKIDFYLWFAFYFFGRLCLSSVALQHLFSSVFFHISQVHCQNDAVS